jgi:hypothetical protein
MPIPVDCPACSRSYQVRDEFANRTIHCKSCGEVMTVPAVSPSSRKSSALPLAGSAASSEDDWAKAFGGGGTPRAKSVSRSGPVRSEPGRSGLDRSGAGRSAGGSGRRESFEDRDEDDDRPMVRRSLRSSSRRSPLLWVVVGLSILAGVGALGIGVMFGMQRRQANTTPGPGGFPMGIPGNNSVPGQPPNPTFPSIDIPRPDFTPPDFTPPGIPPLPNIPPPPFPGREVPRPDTSRPSAPQPSTGPVGPNLKEDPNRPGGFPATPGAAPR